MKGNVLKIVSSFHVAVEFNMEPAEAVLRRVERDTYSVADVRKALCYLLAHVEKGDAPPTRGSLPTRSSRCPPCTTRYARVCSPCCLMPSMCLLALFMLLDPPQPVC